MYRTRAARKDCTENFVSPTLSRKRTRWPPFLHFIAGLNYSANLSSVRFNSTAFCSVYSLWSCFTVHNNRNISFRLVQTKKHCCGNIAALLVLHYIVEISHNLLGKHNTFEQIMSVHFELYVFSGVSFRASSRPDKVQLLFAKSSTGFKVEWYVSTHTLSLSLKS